MPYSNITITTNSGLSFRQNDFIQVSHDSDNYMIGRVVSYNSTNGALTFTPLVVKGSGSFSTWNVTLTGDPGDDGTSGSSGTAGVNSTSGTSGSSFNIVGNSPHAILRLSPTGTQIGASPSFTFDGKTLSIDPLEYSTSGDNPIYRIIYHNDGTAGTAGIVVRGPVYGLPYDGIIENRVPHSYQHQFVVGTNYIAHIDAQGFHTLQPLIADDGVYFQSLERDDSQTKFLVWDPSTSGGLQGKVKWTTSGAAGAQGPAGTPGTSGTAGFSGTSGSSGETGSSGTSGTSGESGASGTSGESGTSGTSGSGFVWQGVWQSIPATYIGGRDIVSYNGGSYIKIGDGNSGSAPPYDPIRWSPVAEPGSSGSSGLTGTSGTSGETGTSGTSGNTGTSGSSGTSGNSGSSGTSGGTGTSGTSGQTGSSGTSGNTGSSGTSGNTGASGSSGTSGNTGASGSSGTSGTSFSSPYSGNLNGTSGQSWMSSYSATTTIDWNNSNVQTRTLASSETFTFSNPQNGATYILVIKQAAAGNYTITWPSINWMGGSPPVMTATANKTDIYTFVYANSTYYGSYAQNF